MARTKTTALDSKSTLQPEASSDATAWDDAASWAFAPWLREGSPANQPDEDPLAGMDVEALLAEDDCFQTRCAEQRASWLEQLDQDEVFLAASQSEGSKP